MPRTIEKVPCVCRAHVWQYWLKHVEGLSWLKELRRDAETAGSRVMATQLQHVDRDSLWPDSSWPYVRAVADGGAC